MTSIPSIRHLEALAADPSLSTASALALLPAPQRAWALATESLGDAVWIARSRASANEVELVYASARLVDWLRAADTGSGSGSAPSAQPAGDAAEQAFEIGQGTAAHRWLRERTIEFDAGLQPADQAAPAASSRDTATHERMVGAVLEDVTERRQSMLALQEDLAAERQARRDAERLTASKDEFISVVSHDLRSPLNAIRGWAHVLKLSSDLTTAQERALDAIDRNITAQARMVDDLLDSQRILRGKLVLSFGQPALADVLDEAVETIRVAAEAKRITIDVSHDHRIGAVEADVDRLRQALSNLLSNSLKFTPEDGRISVATARVDDGVGNGPALRITVADTGMGLTPDQLAHVFDPVMRADQPSGRRQGGLNLPLSLARQLIEMHGGTVSAASEGIDEGLTMVVELPATQQQRLAER